MTDAELLASEALRLLDHEIFRDAFAALEQRHMEAALSCGILADRRRRRHLEAVQTVRDVRDELRRYITAAAAERARQMPRSVA